MKFLIDAQLPPALAHFLEARGHEAKAVRELGMRDADDTAIWDFAQSEEWVVITKDEDFAARTLQALISPKVLWLRIGNSTNKVLFAWIEPLLPAAVKDLQAGHRLVEVKRERW